MKRHADRLAVDAPVRTRRTPEQNLWAAVLERWMDDLDSPVPAHRAEARCHLQPGYSRRWELACAANGLDADAVRAAGRALVSAGQRPPRLTAREFRCGPSGLGG